MTMGGKHISHTIPVSTKRLSSCDFFNKTGELKCTFFQISLYHTGLATCFVSSGTHIKSNQIKQIMSFKQQQNSQLPEIW